MLDTSVYKRTSIINTMRNRNCVINSLSVERNNCSYNYDAIRGETAKVYR